jgi:ATP-binding cassette, subfamily C, bacterial CydD
VRPLDPRLLDRARPARTALIADSALGVCAALLVLAQAVLLARVAAHAFDGAPLSALSATVALLVVVVAARSATAWAFEFAGRRAATTVLSELRLELVESRLRDQPASLDGAESAELATVAVDGIDALETVFARYLPQVVLAVCVPVAVLVLVAWIDPLSAGLMLLTLPLVPVFMWLIGRHTARRARERHQAMALLSGHFLDVVRGLPTLRAFNRGRAQIERVEAVSDEYRRVTMRTLRVAFLSGAVLELAATLGVALIAVTVGVRLVDGSIGFQPALTVLVLAPELYLPIRNLAAQYHAAADGLAVSGRLLDLVDAEPAVARGAATPPSPRDVPVVLDAVTVTYPGRGVPALRSFSLELQPGETVALVGPSGAGKSTAASLLLRLLAPDGGAVTAGSADLAACDPVAWREHVAWVPQRPTLFHGTVADNIRLGVPGAADAAVRRAASMAGADGFVEGLPDGYETVVGEAGRALSAGQRQRIALARAFLREAPLVILDEPTANLDLESVEVVTVALEALRGERTILVITHDAAVAACADRVVRLEHGRIIDLVMEAV